MNRYLPSTDADNDRDSGDDCAGQQYDLADGMFTVTVFSSFTALVVVVIIIIII